MKDLRILLPALLLIFGFGLAQAQVCESKNGTSCDECLRNVSCLWCIPTKSCITYPVRTILPPHAVCPLNDARWGLCWMNFQILIITLSVVSAVIIIALVICMFCCCKCENFGSQRFEAKMARQANKMKTKQEERRAEMRERHDEIRKKYEQEEDRRRTEGGQKRHKHSQSPKNLEPRAPDRPNHVRGEAQGGSQNRERPHQPESGGTGRLRGPVQNQTAHTAQQTHEGVLRETGSFNKADQIQV